jgi:hypothetical protein
MAELLQGDTPVVPLNRKVPLNWEVPLNGALEGHLKEGEGASPPLYLDHSPSCNNSTEIPAHPLSQREYQVKEGEGACLPLYLDHSPSCSSPTEIPAHPLSQRENQMKEGEGARFPLNLDLSLSQWEYQVETGGRGLASF